MTDQKTKDPTIRLEQMLCFALYGTAHAFSRAYKPLLEPLGLTYPQYLVMISLWERDGQPVKALSDALGLDSGTLSPLLKRLEQAGLLARARAKADERQVLITLTQTGRALQEKAAEITPAIARATGCSLDEVVALRDRLMELQANLIEAGDRLASERR
ncbi:MarR family winged helix-turn-helix transcriptional regulator [Rhizobium sp. SSA_523]|uniref:MarR family winged helix-turn-helix transcriptional regulator n=1 Tax=Rhizobium sp. SSA_523 TaxID=2952477 RepID=UPI0020911F3F|nr:MarR family transcriptional regulator [Rhizobium sp. SSA_523]MCO5731906.1 MarR family transcriptional regulator [Rhizobium sp. SSA_523]WKC22740.1 MarR family transcriptional regulator [Rhizobium sp. SSA_523]